MKKLLAFSLASLLCLMTMTVSAQSVSAEQASMVCNRFLSEKYPNAQTKAPSYQLQETIADKEGMVCLYRFSVNDLGFVIVSASLATPPVLAYSFDEKFEMIPPVRDLFHLYKQEIRFAETAKLPAKAKAAADWSRYLAEEFVADPSKSFSAGPLLTTRWNQNKFYNTYCPWDVNAGSYYDYRVPNGCVALASSQIMNYHHYPESGSGATSYIPHGYPRQTVYYTNHKYHWDAMCNEPQSYANEIAKLAYHFGVAIQMNYNYDGSGAQTDEAKRQLSQRFKYDQSITSYYRGNYLDTLVSEFIAAMKDQIDRKLPVYYSGCTADYQSCHAYVVDGYDENDCFHINYGWGGASNGFYAIDNFVSGSSHFDYGAEAIFNIFPSGAYPDTYCQGHTRKTASFGYITDGSPTAKHYQSNPDCSWMVAVPHANSYTFHFDRIDLNTDVDYVTIYDGPTTSSNTVAVLTGKNLPTQDFTVTADSVLITFTSNGSAENTDCYGFQISYSTTLPQRSCATQTNVSDWTTEISDGTTDGADYLPQTNCNWIVNLNYISGYAFNFTKFDLGYGDFVDVYNASTNPPTLYKRFDIYNPPTDIYNVNFKKMKINFVADNWDQNDGFKLRYYAIASVDEYSGLEDVNVYPNPATDNLHVDFSLNESGHVLCRLMDAAGKIVRTQDVEAVSGENHTMMNVSNLAKGFYMLEMTTPTGKSIQKVMVQ
ncbi:MAG: C10 family peptidase [Bacteroidales bacterium]|nr:C10 family peptidase [Bacteroidales bacterium]